ncbi:hypothetical protein [Sediminicurvatus halobius]|uniref:hypothetical protein n=1 Tax=Sediminicurvatus halobius TaxID=2182432 RepID=UPI0013049C5C|nr:hypothetical protein [Spiribacter halobius]UEX76217.1 hypothetical protein LMH63_09580 [Spiribacter halobius]
MIRIDGVSNADCRAPGRYGVMVGLLLALLLLAGCATYDDRVAPVRMPTEEAGAVDIGGALVSARAFVDPQAAEEAFGFDIRGAGLLPVQFVVDNRSGADISVEGERTLLADREGNAWPVLESRRAAERVRESVAAGESIQQGARSSLLTGLAGAVAGAAIGIVTGESAGEGAARGAAAGAAIGGIAGGASAYAGIGRDIQEDLREQSLADRLIEDGELAYGFLFFPGRNEAESAESLRLSLRIGEETRIARVPVVEVQTGR